MVSIAAAVLSIWNRFSNENGTRLRVAQFTPKRSLTT